MYVWFMCIFDLFGCFQKSNFHIYWKPDVFLKYLLFSTFFFLNFSSSEIFAAIPTNVQCQMLLSVADKISSTLERCRLLLLAMRNFPNLVQEHGVSSTLDHLHTKFVSFVCKILNCYFSAAFLLCNSWPAVFTGAELYLNSLKSSNASLEKTLLVSLSFM